MGPATGYITDSGFGVCQNGAIGFAEDVFPSPSSMSIATLRAQPAVESVEQQQKPRLDSLEKKSAVMSNREAQDQMVLRSFTPKCVTYCTCPDGGVPSASGGTQARAIEAAAGLGKKNLNMIRSDISAGPNLMGRRTLQEEPTNSHMNKLVFEAVTGKKYTKAAVQKHKVVDIFNTFPDGVPTHSSMSPMEKQNCALLSTLLHSVRANVRECAMLGKQISGENIETLKHVAHSLHELANTEGDASRKHRLMDAEEHVRGAAYFPHGIVGSLTKKEEKFVEKHMHSYTNWKEVKPGVRNDMYEKMNNDKKSLNDKEKILFRILQIIHNQELRHEKYENHHGAQHHDHAHQSQGEDVLVHVQDAQHHHHAHQPQGE